MLYYIVCYIFRLMRSCPDGGGAFRRVSAFSRETQVGHGGRWVLKRIQWSLVRRNDWREGKGRVPERTWKGAAFGITSYKIK